MLARSKRQGLAVFVVAVLLQGNLDHLARRMCLFGREIGEKLAVTSLCLRIAHDFRQTVQVLGGVVRSEIGAMSPQCPVFHEAVFEKDILAPVDVVHGEQNLPRRTDRPRGNGQGTLIGSHRNDGEQGEAKNHD